METPGARRHWRGRARGRDSLVQKRPEYIGRPRMAGWARIPVVRRPRRLQRSPVRVVALVQRRRPTTASRCALRWIYSLTNLAIGAGCTGPIQTLDSDGTFVRLTGYLHPWWAFASSRLPHAVGDFARPEAQRYRLGSSVG